MHRPARFSRLAFIIILSFYPVLLSGQTVSAVSAKPEAEALFQRGIRYLLNQQLDLAEQSMLKSLLIDPDNGKIHWETGWVYWQKKQWIKVIHHWTKTKILTPHQKDLAKFLGLAQQYLKWEIANQNSDKVYRGTSSFRMNPAGQITLTAVGDIMMGSDYESTKKLPPNDGQNLFQHVIKDLAGDIVFGNLEGPLTEETVSTKCKNGGDCFVFRTPSRYVKNLKTAGFNVVNVANNHITDFGLQGVKDTLSTLEENEILSFGYISQPRAIIEVNQIKVGFLGDIVKCCVQKS